MRGKARYTAHPPSASITRLTPSRSSINRRRYPILTKLIGARPVHQSAPYAKDRQTIVFVLPTKTAKRVCTITLLKQIRLRMRNAVLMLNAECFVSLSHKSRDPYTHILPLCLFLSSFFLSCWDSLFLSSSPLLRSPLLHLSSFSSR
jgi:hypothetical protein